ncbi:MAG: GNAT family N-acetyltransferase [Deltaproteobacteria bacterium]|nr:GNAT family N-acetyltransferase [Deltaproteobacteria bacterium]
MTVEIRVLRGDDDRSPFRSGDEALDLFFHRYAGQNQFRHHIGVTYVAVEEERIVGFATVAAASLDADDLPSGRRMPPYPLPVLRVARLAVGESEQGRGLGRALLRFCVELAEKMRDELGCVGLVVDAKPRAVDFYRGFGLIEVIEAEGGAQARPKPTMMFLPLAAVPRRP